MPKRLCERAQLSSVVAGGARFTLRTLRVVGPVLVWLASAPAAFAQTTTCLRDLLAKEGYFAFSAVTLGGQGVPGAVGDLVHAPLSHALQRIAAPGPKGIFASMFAGVLVDFTSLDPRLSRAGAIRLWCWGTPLAQALRSATWPQVFTDDGTHRNDGIVSHASQRNGLSNVATIENVLHSGGMRELGFRGFTVLDPDVLAGPVISVLNQPRGNTTYYSVLNPLRTRRSERTRGGAASTVLHCTRQQTGNCARYGANGSSIT